MNTSLDPNQWIISKHALKRMLEMTLDPDEVVNCLKNPEFVRASERHAGWNYRRGPITCGVVEDDGKLVVVTVVWSSNDGWANDFRRAEYDDREFRGPRGLLVH